MWENGLICSSLNQKQRAKAAVPMPIDDKWKHQIKNYSYINERNLIVRLEIDRGDCC